MYKEIGANFLYKLGRTELQIAFELALYYDSPTPEYVGIEEGTQFNYDIYTNDTISANLLFPTKYYQNMSLEVIKVFGEDINSGRTPFIVNFSMQGDYNLWDVEDVLIVGYIHSDNKMYFDPFVISSVGPFFFVPIFVNNKMNWTEFALSYNNYSVIGNSNYYSVSELPNGFNFYQRDYANNVTSSYKYNESGVLTEFTVYYNDCLYHNCTLEEIIDPPVIIDAYSPVITVLNPSSAGLYGVTPFEFNLILEEEQLNCAWLTISDGNVEFTQHLSFASDGVETEIAGQVSESSWNLLSDGNITVRFWANDTSGNLNWKEVSVVKDATAPSISIVIEIINGTAPKFDLRIRELHLNCTWYVINGSEPQYIVGNAGTINQTMWESQANGPVVIEFTALDCADNMGIIAAIVPKHTVDPGLQFRKITGKIFLLEMFNTHLLNYLINWEPYYEYTSFITPFRFYPNGSAVQFNKLFC